MTDIDLDAIRFELVAAERPVSQGSGAIWALTEQKDRACRVARQLLARLGEVEAENRRLRSVVDELLRFGEVAQAWRSYYVPEIDKRNEHLFGHELPLIRAVDRVAGLCLVWVYGRLVDVRLPDDDHSGGLT